MVKDILRWARDVVVEHEVGAPLPVRLAADGDAIEADLRDDGGEPVGARIPISRRPNPAPHPILKEIHACEVAGRTLEAHDGEALLERVGAALETIAPGGVLPLLWFRAPATGYEVAAYRDGGELACPVLGAGRRLRAPTVAGLRDEVTRHLVSSGQLHEDDELEVRLLRPADVRRVAPAAVLVSPRSWLPCLGADGAVETIDPVGDAPLRAPDVIEILRAARERTGDEDLHVTGADQAAWYAAAARSSDSGLRLTATGDGAALELEIRRLPAGELAVAVEDGGVSVFVAGGPEALAALVGARLAGSGLSEFRAD
jgi:hypothetical protein